MLHDRRLLREEFRSGRLAAAQSKAAALQALCERLKFDPNDAAAINRDLFTERIETFLEDEKLTGELRRSFTWTLCKHRMPRLKHLAQLPQWILSRLDFGVPTARAPVGRPDGANYISMALRTVCLC
jgi:hypothetical protein